MCFAVDRRVFKAEKRHWLLPILNTFLQKTEAEAADSERKWNQQPKEASAAEVLGLRTTQNGVKCGMKNDEEAFISRLPFINKLSSERKSGLEKQER